MYLRVIAALITAIWLILIALGKRGFVHILILNAIGIVAVDAMMVFRSRLTIKSNADPQTRHQTLDLTTE